MAYVARKPASYPEIDLNVSKNSRSPCGHLVNNSPCITPGCDFSHDAWLVRRWQDRPQRPCHKGGTCPHLQAGCCLYYHPKSHLRYRDNAVTTGLASEPLEVLPLSTLVAEKTISIEDRGDLASFNKLSDGEIVVPGSPPFFSPLTHAVEVKLDSHNRELQPGYPHYAHAFEPLLRSVETMAPGFNVLGAAEIVSNASNLRKMFHTFSNQKRLTERYDLEWRHNTLFVSKWTGDPSLRSSLGHGAGFEKETCRYGTDDDDMLHRSASHHRVVRYRFAGLELVVQSEVDAYYCECVHPTTSAPRPIPAGSPNTRLAAGSGMNRPWRRLSPPTTPSSSPPSPGWFSPTSRNSFSRHSPPSPTTFTAPPSPPLPPPTTTPPSSPPRQGRFSFLALALDDPGDSPSYTALQASIPHLRLPASSPTLHTHRWHGRDVPSACLLEVKTHRASNKPMFAPEAQLYFSRRRLLYVAQHRAGVFVPGPTSAVLHDYGVDGGLELWERRAENQAVLGRLAALLRLLRERVGVMAEERPGVRVSLVCEADGSGDEGGVSAALYLRTDGVSLLPDTV